MEICPFEIGGSLKGKNQLSNNQSVVAVFIISRFNPTVLVQARFQAEKAITNISLTATATQKEANRSLALKSSKYSVVR